MARTSERFPSGSVVKNPLVNAGAVGSIPGLGKSPGEGKGNPHQYSCLGNLTDKGAWWATVQGGHKRVGHDLATKQQQQELLKSKISFLGVRPLRQAIKEKLIPFE